MGQFLQVLEAISKYGGLVIIAGLFIVLLYLDRKDRKEKESQEREEKQAERKESQAILSELSASNRNIAESLNLLKTSMDNTNNEFKQHDERAIKQFSEIKQDLIILKERGK